MLPIHFRKNKSFLSPRADEVSTAQLRFLIISSPFTVILNNYKSNLFSLDSLRALVYLNNGFTYHPNKNVKTRAFKEFNTVLSSDVLNGLVVFAFFGNYKNLVNFLNSLENVDYLPKLSYYSLLVDGHVVGKNLLSNPFFNSPKTHLVYQFLLICHKNILTKLLSPAQFSLYKILFILNAHIKSIS